MSGERWLDACRDGCAAAAAAGATDAEVFAQRTDEVSVAIEKHDLQVARSSTETTFGVRAFVGDRVGFASTNVPGDLAVACRDAVALAKASPGDPCNRLPEAHDVRPIADLCDPDSQRIGTADIVRTAAHMLRLAESIDRRLVVGDGGASSIRSLRAIATTRGLAAEEATTLFTHHVLVTARDSDEVSSMDFQFGAARFARDVDVAPAVTLACRNALDSLGGTKGKPFRGLVILSPSAVLDVLVAPLLFQTNGRNVVRGISRWRTLGQEVASPAVSLVDDGTIPGGVASSAFDREGVPHARCSIVELGRLESFLHNAYSGAGLGRASTGHAAGGAGSPPLIGPTNLAWRPGRGTFEDQVADTREGVLVARFSGNVDPVSGDFSGVAKAAHLVRGGRRVSALSGALVAGNVFDALRAVVDVSSETRQIFGFSLPYVRLDGVSVTAE